MGSDRILTVREAAEHLGVTKTCVLSLIRRKKLPAERHGEFRHPRAKSPGPAFYLIRESDVRQMLSNRAAWYEDRAQRGRLRKALKEARTSGLSPRPWNSMRKGEKRKRRAE